MKITKKPTVSAVYRILNLISGKHYIGASGDALKRMYEHQQLLKRGNHPNSKLQQDYLDFGKKAFSFDILEVTADYKYQERYILERADNSKLYNRTNTCSYETFDNEEIVSLGKYLFTKRIDCFNGNHRLYAELSKRRLLDLTFSRVRKVSLGKPKSHFCFFSDQTNKVYFNQLAGDSTRNLCNFQKSRSHEYQVIKIDAVDVQTFKDQYRDLGYDLYERSNSRYRLVK